MNMLRVAFVLVCSLRVALACSCVPPSLKRDFFDANTQAMIKGKVLYVSARGTGAHAMRLFVIETQHVYKGCDVPSFIIAQSFVQSATCGINLNVRSSYLLPLNNVALPSLNLCQFIREFETLSEEQVRFLHTRELCCDGRCECVNSSTFNCFRQPCSPPEQPPCEEALKCVDNYCGGCFAEWFTREGQYACLPSLY